MCESCILVVCVESVCDIPYGFVQYNYCTSINTVYDLNGVDNSHFQSKSLIGCPFSDGTAFWHKKFGFLLVKMHAWYTL